MSAYRLFAVLRLVDGVGGGLLQIAETGAVHVEEQPHAAAVEGAGEVRYEVALRRPAGVQLFPGPDRSGAGGVAVIRVQYGVPRAGLLHEAGKRFDVEILHGLRIGLTRPAPRRRQVEEMEPHAVPRLGEPVGVRPVAVRFPARGRNGIHMRNRRELQRPQPEDLAPFGTRDAKPEDVHAAIEMQLSNGDPLEAIELALGPERVLVRRAGIGGRAAWIGQVEALGEDGRVFDGVLAAGYFDLRPRLRRGITGRHTVGARGGSSNAPCDLAIAEEGQHHAEFSGPEPDFTAVLDCFGWVEPFDGIDSPDQRSLRPCRSSGNAGTALARGEPLPRHPPARCPSRAPRGRQPSGSLCE